MSWRRLLHSPPPVGAWMLDGEALVVARRDRARRLQLATAQTPPGLVEVGPVGLQGIDRASLHQLVQALQSRVDGGRRPVLVVPTGWVRSHLLEFEHLPRKVGELDEVVRWRLKKLLPVHPNDLRVAAVPQQRVDGKRQILCLAALEKPMAELEGAFADAGVQPGVLSSALFALANGAVGASRGLRLVVQKERGFLSLLLLAGNHPRLLRTKPLSALGETTEIVLRELQLAVVYIRETLALADPLEVSLSFASEDMGAAVAEWWSRQADVVLVPPPGPLEVSDPGVAAQAGSARVGLVAAVLLGGEA